MAAHKDMRPLNCNDYSVFGHRNGSKSETRPLPAESYEPDLIDCRENRLNAFNSM